MRALSVEISKFKRQNLPVTCQLPLSSCNPDEGNTGESLEGQNARLKGAGHVLDWT